MMENELSHLKQDGSAHMVDVSKKKDTARTATAEAIISAEEKTITAIKAGDLPKGDVFGTARIAAIMAAKKTSDIIPLCHPLPLSSISVDFDFISATEIRVVAFVKTTGKTGVEMEALTAVSVAALTLYDMAKAVDKAICITQTRLLSKEGGKSGTYYAD